jgi:glycosyltransferase involved in cell wall biosynthesis
LHDLRDAGHPVVSIAPTDEHSQLLISEGIPHRHLPLEGASVNPFREVTTVLALRRILAEEQVDVVLSYTPKGNIYSGLAVTGRATQLVANVSGLGRLFVEDTWLTFIARQLYRLAFRRAARVFFQNEEDSAVFTEVGLISANKAERIPGSGVDLAHFCPIDSLSPKETNAPIFLLIARMLWDKGVGEFIEAARHFRRHYPAARFQLLGFLDVANPSAVSWQTVTGWVEEGIVEYLGTTDDVRPFLDAADCIVLPSFYREGVPRSLLEAAAMAKPVITTDATGCRDTVEDGITGFLCHPRDAKSLADKMFQFVSMPVVERQLMGARGREKMVNEFDERIVIDRYLSVIRGLATSV